MKCEKCGYEKPCPVCSGAIVTPQSKYELWLDLSHYDGKPDFKVFKDNGVVGICAKIGFGYANARGGSGSEIDDKFREYMTDAGKEGFKLAGYWWSHPLESWGRQAETCLLATKEFKLDWIASDMEQEEGWKQILDKRKGKYVWRLVTLDGKEISACNKYLLDKFVQAGYRSLLYTRDDYIDGNAPQVKDWMKQFELWISGMPYEKVITCDRFTALAKGFTYCATWQEWYEKHALKPEGDFKPLVPDGTDWTIWQFSFDHVKLPGADSFLDINWMKI